MKTKEFADSILNSIQFAIDAHIHNPKKQSDAVRFWDRNTPYVVHPIWCAMTLLTETTLDESIRFDGFAALLWHDVLEDTQLDLPETTPNNVKKYISDMTFMSFSDEIEGIWKRDKIIRLFKLYDKTSNLLDGTWMKDDKWNRYVDFTNRLNEDVLSNYGELNITKIATSVCVKRGL